MGATGHTTEVTEVINGTKTGRTGRDTYEKLNSILFNKTADFAVMGEG